MYFSILIINKSEMYDGNWRMEKIWGMSDIWARMLFFEMEIFLYIIYKNFKTKLIQFFVRKSKIPSYNFISYSLSYSWLKPHPWRANKLSIVIRNLRFHRRFPAEIVAVDVSGRGFERMSMRRRSLLSGPGEVQETSVKRRSRPRRPRGKRRNTIAGTDQKEIRQAIGGLVSSYLILQFLIRWLWKVTFQTLDDLL